MTDFSCIRAHPDDIEAVALRNVAGDRHCKRRSGVRGSRVSRIDRARRRNCGCTTQRHGAGVSVQRRESATELSRRVDACGNRRVADAQGIVGDVPTFRLSVWVFAVAPAVVALIVIGNVPSGVLDNVEMLKLTDTGLLFVGVTDLDG
jgi:hypothetical protein